MIVHNIQKSTHNGSASVGMSMIFYYITCHFSNINVIAHELSS
jgi:hypothetical protein